MNVNQTVRIIPTLKVNNRNINEVFYTHLFAKLNIDIKNIIYIQNKLYKSFKDSSNVVILNEKNIRKINSILFMVINHEN